MTNKELQILLKTFPDDAVIFTYNDGDYDEYHRAYLDLNYRDLREDTYEWEGEGQLHYTTDEIHNSKVKTIIL